jgi:hypothetical protein
MSESDHIDTFRKMGVTYYVSQNIRAEIMEGCDHVK